MRLWVDCGLQIKQVGDDGRIEGMGAVFGNVDLGMDRIERGAFGETLKGQTDPVPMLWQHSPHEPIGVWDALAETRDGLKVSGQINLETQRGREARSLAKQGAVTGLSIGYTPVDFKFEDDVRVLEKVELWEVSLATFPMNPEARVAGVKNFTRKELERSLRDSFGLPRRLATNVATYMREMMDDEQKRASRHVDTSSVVSVIDQIRGSQSEIPSIVEHIRSKTHGT